MCFGTRQKEARSRETGKSEFFFLFLFFSSTEKKSLKLTELTSCASPASTAPAPSGALYWKTGRCCRMWCLTAETSAVRTCFRRREREKERERGKKGVSFASFRQKFFLENKSSKVLTQYFVVDLTKPCDASSFLTPEASPRRAE